MKKNRLIQFLGGKTSYYVLGLIILCAIAAFYLNKSRFFLILFCHYFYSYSTIFIRPDLVLFVQSVS